MNILKRNQIIISVIALMLITAGYFSYTDNALLETSSQNTNEEYSGIGDATLVSSNVTENLENTIQNTNTVANTMTNTNVTNTNSTNTTVVETNSDVAQNTNNSSDEYFTSSRLKRDTMYSQMLESYQKILDSSSISDDQKLISQNEIQKINSTKNAIMICENLINTKGFADVVIFVNEDSVSVVIKAEELKKEEIAQIQNIVVRELKASTENIHISTKN